MWYLAFAIDSSPLLRILRYPEGGTVAPSPRSSGTMTSPHGCPTGMAHDIPFVAMPNQMTSLRLGSKAMFLVIACSLVSRVRATIESVAEASVLTCSSTCMSTCSVRSGWWAITPTVSTSNAKDPWEMTASTRPCTSSIDEMKWEPGRKEGKRPRPPLLVLDRSNVFIDQSNHVFVR